MLPAMQPVLITFFFLAAALLAASPVHARGVIDKVMVNADDAALRGNRLALLRTLGDRLGSVAAIEHLSN